MLALFSWPGLNIQAPVVVDVLPLSKHEAVRATALGHAQLFFSVDARYCFVASVIERNDSKSQLPIFSHNLRQIFELSQAKSCFFHL